MLYSSTISTPSALRLVTRYSPGELSVPSCSFSIYGRHADRHATTSHRTLRPSVNRLWIYTHLTRHVALDKLDTIVLHVLPHNIGALLVEAAQQDGPHHDGDVQADACEETSTLQRDVGGADTQRLTGTVGQGKQVIAAGEESPSYECEVNVAMEMGEERD